jgi:glutathione synthase/RimK-type ligase-like ATP-grasp enzyme
VEAGIAHRRAFVEQVTSACARLGATVRWHSDDWVAEIDAPARRVLLIGQVFPLNTASSAHVANDKVATADLLSALDVPVVPHHLVRFPADLDAAVERVLGLCGGAPLVVKPHRESSGVDVRRAEDAAGVRSLLVSSARRYRAVAVSPWWEVRDEHRVVVLDDEPLLVYRKDRSGAEWRHNLQFGARPALDVDPVLRGRLETTARAAMRALGLRFASVDLVRTSGAPHVLEVNSGVTLAHFGRAGAEHRRLAEDVYFRAVRASVAP